MEGGGGIFGSLFGGSIAEQFNKTITYNIPQAMRMLFKEEQYFVGVLIGLFAVVVPVLKTLMTLVYLMNKSNRLYAVMSFMGKFAMADVFCVGIFMAYLYTKANQVIKMDINTGYYWFAAYVLLNIMATMLIYKPKKQTI